MDAETWISVIHVFLDGCILVSILYSLYKHYLEKKNRYLVVPPGKSVLSLRDGRYVFRRAGEHLLNPGEQLVSFLWFTPEKPSSTVIARRYTPCTEIDETEQHMDIAKRWIFIKDGVRMSVEGTVQFRVIEICNLTKVAQPLLLLETYAKSAIFNAITQHKSTDSIRLLEHQIAYHLNQDLIAYGMLCTRFIVKDFQRLEVNSIE